MVVNSGIWGVVEFCGAEETVGVTLGEEFVVWVCVVVGLDEGDGLELDEDGEVGEEDIWVGVAEGVAVAVWGDGLDAGCAVLR